jgi:hypothetical protein
MRLEQSMKSTKKNNDVSPDSGKVRFQITTQNGHSADRVVCDFSNQRTIYSQVEKDCVPIIEKNEKLVIGFFSPEEVDQFNSLINGQATNTIAKSIGIHRLRCGVRLYRILNRFFNLKKDCRGNFDKRLIAYAKRRREICGQRPRLAGKKEAAERWLQFINELRREEELPIRPVTKESIDCLASAMFNEEMLQEAISMFDSEPEALRKLQWSEEETLFKKPPDCPLYFLILFLGVHLLEKSPNRKCPPYTMIGRFLMEQDIKTYTREKDTPEAREKLESKDVKRYFIKAQKIREGLDMFYEQCRNIYIAPLTLLSSRTPNSENPVIEAMLEADRHLRVFADTPVADAPSFCQLFPPLEEILLPPND